ncbi:hypothetical protein KY338_01805 [Candidatus Woesearchaeota archaeon]|nr:hypothetical protein [Candidatus Woesearchaeota archaeon]MBW3005987.1 hypothetical protein [Candidatus Woesearchaeota archaeon]
MGLRFNVENARVMLDVLYEPGYTFRISGSSFGSSGDDEEGFWVYFSNGKESIDMIVTYRGEGIYLERTPGYRSHAEDHPFQENRPAITGDPQSLRDFFEKMKKLPGSRPGEITDLVHRFD